MEWKIKKGSDEFPCPDAATLKGWTSEGRILRDDYVFNPVLGQWLYAKDVAEIQGYFVRQEHEAEAKRLKDTALIFWILSVVMFVIFQTRGLDAFLLISLALTVGYYLKKPS